MFKLKWGKQPNTLEDDRIADDMAVGAVEQLMRVLTNSKDNIGERITTVEERLKFYKGEEQRLKKAHSFCNNLLTVANKEPEKGKRIHPKKSDDKTTVPP